MCVCSDAWVEAGMLRALSDEGKRVNRRGSGMVCVNCGLRHK